MGHPNLVQNLLRLQVPPAAPQTRRDRETSFSVGMETKPDKFLRVDMITVLRKKKERERIWLHGLHRLIAAVIPD